MSSYEWQRPSRVEVTYGEPTISMATLRDYLGVFYEDADEDTNYQRILSAATDRVSNILRAVVGGWDNTSPYNGETAGRVYYYYNYWQTGDDQNFLLTKWRGWGDWQDTTTYLGAYVTVEPETGYSHSGYIDQGSGLQLVDLGYAWGMRAQFGTSFTNIDPQPEGIQVRLYSSAASLPDVGKATIDTAVLMEAKYLVALQNGAENAENLPRADHFLSGYRL